MEVDFVACDNSALLYESAIEEIALEGLSGITLQALFLRLTEREQAPLVSNEAVTVVESLFNCLKHDERLTLHLLPDPRPNLVIWNKNEHHDNRGQVEEPDDSPNEIYLYKLIEKKNFDEDIVEKRENMFKQRNLQLTHVEIERLNVTPKGEFLAEGIRFSKTCNFPVTRKKKKRKKVKYDDNVVGQGFFAIRGSCPEFNTRRDITEIVRRTNIDYHTAVHLFGNRLVFVASQFMRESLIFRRFNQMEVSGLQYCLVERVGRARRYGEQARGKISLTTMGIDAKALFYFRKLLLTEGIISKQPLVMRFGAQMTGSLISLFHLPHFFTREDSASFIKVRKIFAYICNAPRKMAEFTKLVHIFGKHLMRSLVDEYADLVILRDMLFVDVYPEELEKEMPTQKKEALMKKRLRVICLRDPGISLREVIHRQLTSKQDAEDDEELKLEDDENGDTTFDWRYCYVPDKVLAHESEASQVVRHAITCGKYGMLQQEIPEKLSVSSLDARSAIRYLTRWKLINSTMEDVGKTKVTRWTLFKCEPYKKPEEKEAEIDFDFLDTVKDPEAAKSAIKEKENEEAGPSPKKKSNWNRKTIKLHVEVDPQLLALKRDSNKNNLHASPEDKPEMSELAPTKPLIRQSRKRKAINSSLPLAPLPPPKKAKTKRPTNPIIMDKGDHDACAKRERQRVDWSAEEDRALIQLFIASIIFIPRYNLDKVFIFNSPQIRDILHAQLPTTATKTTTTIKRRIHKMFRRADVFVKYRSLLDEAIRDEALWKTYIEPTLPPPSVTIFYTIPNQKLESVFLYLQKKFSQNEIEGNLTTNVETILDTRELHRMEEMWLDIWANVFHYFYKDRKVLRALMEPETVIRIQGDEVVEEPRWVLPRATSPVPKQGEKMIPNEPLKYSDEQLDFVYTVASSILKNVGEIDQELYDSSDDEDGEGEAKVLLKSSGGFPRPLCSGEREPASGMEVFMWRCRTVFLSVLLGGSCGNGEALNDFIDLIPNNLLEKIVTSFKSLGVFIMTKPNRKIVLSIPMKRKLSGYLHPSAFQTAAKFLEPLQKGEPQTEFPGTNSHLGAAYLLSEIGPLLTISFTLPPSIIKIHEDWREDYESILAAQQVENEGEETTPGEQQETALRLLRFKLNADNDKGKMVEKDFFDINLPQLKLVANEDEGLQALSEVNIVKVTSVLGQEKEILAKRLLQLVEYDAITGKIGGFDYPFVGEFKELYDVINITKDVGISISFLKNHFPRSVLKEGLTYLLRRNYIFVVGVQCRKFVAAPNMKNWSVLIEDEEEESKRIVMRPWVNAFGELNWKLIDRAIVSIIGVLRKNPHTFIANLANHFSLLFSPAEIAIFILALLDLHLVNIFKYNAKKEKGFCLFSTWVDEGDEEAAIENSFKDYTIDPILDLESAWIELTPFHISKYSRIQAIILSNVEAEGDVINEEDNLDKNLLDDELDQDEFPRFEPEDVEIMEQGENDEISNDADYN